ncbi:hypothetical protein [Acinetobacter calcoaceticus]|uniref:Glycosyltransferase n=1 Tax=Acinetobacter calcoaceticus TaxID=471 RepID=A0ABD5ARP4_ACICA|nr:hypothetical protein [Acinetobacter calcoaceticus]MDP9804988.1 hypothetical protein [Acinetobacter calcoaceticus]
MKNIIFHCPFPLDNKAKSASGIRPIKMLNAFRSLGYNIDLVVGYSDERRIAIKKIKEKIQNGYSYSFVYSESSTMPTALTDPHHLPLNPFLDFNFFNFLKKNNIRIGLFYRDIHWKFDHYGIGLSWYKKQLALFFYYFDLKQYNKLVDVFYLPSMQMGKYIDYIDTIKFKALPPAHDLSNYGDLTPVSNIINLLYVGGIGENYKLNKLFEAMILIPNINLTICTREADWEKNKDKYTVIPKNIRIVHESGKGLDELYRTSHIALLFVEPKDYWDFAVPFKLFEYIGRNKPIICCKNTWTGDFVEEKNIGWVIDYNVQAFVDLLSNLNPSSIIDSTEKVIEIKGNESWISRAEQVIHDLNN